MNEPFLWDDVSGEENVSANVPYVVRDSAGLEVWSGLAVGSVETPNGGLSIRRLTFLDGHQVTAEVVLLAKGAWAFVESGGFVVDMEDIRFQEQQMRTAKEANAAMLAEQAAAARRAGSGLAVPVPIDGRRPPFN